MSELVKPFGGNGLKPLLISETQREIERERASTLTKVPMTSRETSDLLMMGMGSYTPIDGFMGYDDWRGVCQEMSTSAGTFWPIPITLSCSAELASRIKINEEVTLIILNKIRSNFADQL